MAKRQKKYTDIPMFERDESGVLRKKARRKKVADPDMAAARKRDPMPECPQCVANRDLAKRSGMKSLPKVNRVRMDAFGMPTPECDFHVVKRGHERLLNMERIAPTKREAIGLRVIEGEGKG